MSEPTDSVKADASQSPIDYSLLSPGRSVEWETRPDGIIIRIPPSPPSHSPRPVDRRRKGIEWGAIVLASPIALVAFVFSFRLGCPAFFVIPFLSTLLVATIIQFIIPTYILQRYEWPKRKPAVALPVVIEIRSGLLFIHDPLKPVAFPKIWDCVLADYNDLAIEHRSGTLAETRHLGELQLVQRGESPYTKTNHRVLSDFEVGELKVIADLIRPFLVAAQNDAPSWSPQFKAPPEYFQPSRFTPPPPLEVRTTSVPAADSSKPLLSMRVAASPLVRRPWISGDDVGCLAGLLFATLLGFIFVFFLSFISWQLHDTPAPTWVAKAFPLIFGGMLLAGLAVFAGIALQKSPSPGGIVFVEVRDGILHCQNPNGGRRNRQHTLRLTEVLDLRGLANPKASHQCGRLMAHLKNGTQVELITHQRVEDLKQIMGHLRKHLGASSLSAATGTEA